MTNGDDNPTDTARTNRAHAGEAIEDARNWPGYGLIALGLVRRVELRTLALVGVGADLFFGILAAGAVVMMVVAAAAGIASNLSEKSSRPKLRRADHH